MAHLTEFISIRMKPDLLARIRARAKAEGCAPSVYARRVLSQLPEPPANENGQTEIISLPATITALEILAEIRELHPNSLDAYLVTTALVHYLLHESGIETRELKTLDIESYTCGNFRCAAYDTTYANAHQDAFYYSNDLETVICATCGGTDVRARLASL